MTEKENGNDGEKGAGWGMTEEAGRGDLWVPASAGMTAMRGGNDGKRRTGTTRVKERKEARRPWLPGPL